jgi:hypothetical protein
MRPRTASFVSGYDFPGSPTNDLYSLGWLESCRNRPRFSRNKVRGEAAIKPIDAPAPPRTPTTCHPEQRSPQRPESNPKGRRRRGPAVVFPAPNPNPNPSPPRTAPNHPRQALYQGMSSLTPNRALFSQETKNAAQPRPNPIDVASRAPPRSHKSLARDRNQAGPPQTLGCPARKPPHSEYC